MKYCSETRQFYRRQAKCVNRHFQPGLSRRKQTRRRTWPSSIEVCGGSRLGRIETLLQPFHTIASDVPTMESVTVDQGQALQLNHREICHAYYERGAEMDAEFDSYGSHCPETRDYEHIFVAVGELPSHSKHQNSQT